MTALDYLRVFNLVAICLSVGFVLALGLSHWRQLPAYVYGLGVSYCLFAAGSAVELEIALHESRPASWRTVVLTLGAVCGLVTAGLAWRRARTTDVK